MTVETPAAIAPAVSPGYCSEHPNQRLVSHRAAGTSRWWGHEDPDVVCVMPHGPDGQAEERCRECGGPLWPATTPTWNRYRPRYYCTPNHRLRAWRRQRAASS